MALECRDFSLDDCIGDLYRKYLELSSMYALPCAQEFKNRLMPLIESKERIFDLGSSINAITHLHGQMFIAQALKRLEPL
jgi:hypothetical protein